MDSAESSVASTPARAPAVAPKAAVGPRYNNDGGDDDDDGVPMVARCVSSMIDSGDPESHRLFLARRTALEMLRDRRYAVPEADLARTLPEFRAWWAERPEIDRLSFSTTLASDPSNKVQLVFCPPEPFKIAAIREVYGRVKDENLSCLILVLQSKITSRAKDAIKEIFKYKVDVFQIAELLVNVTKHVLKPEHEVLTPEEKAHLLKKYNVVDSQLPRMLETDAIARYYGLGKGTVLRVTYDGELTGNHVTYRCIF
ncbi:DNA-directed RNA polymerase V subunit 5A [Brachypodium distachyon]|uniref:RNA polymerase subunit H/Rpb5 C-terminal domain-containing protein n=1 Tax=Brachypodium distachyon TaxID=15368 RepID=I1INU4_BRADI|nr:DNA-directed RNA polymerase V subunit 5A [Brachypodium distachyon]KQJ89582.1 hypothetical protein BRADI_4g26550v3 [Brachypodium distachyon]|eukprot:XP_010237978.1 DNA-directed RNA polymerase V subunit 5A [Brachypodium distachyon]